MGRRGENIRKRADGRWEARVVQGRPVLGKTNYKYFYGRRYQEVKQKKKSFLCGLPAPELSISEQLLLGRLQPEGTFPRRILFRDVVCEWLRSKEVIREGINAGLLFQLGKKSYRPNAREVSCRQNRYRNVEGLSVGNESSWTGAGRWASLRQNRL